LAHRHRPFQAGSRVRLHLTADDRLVKSIRHGDRAAFEALYDRHAAGLLSFCLYMLGSRHDAEDAVQATFASAYRSLLADDRPVTVRPWLYTIARNASLSILRRRHPTVELNGEPALTGDPQRELELHDEVRQVLGSLLALPERQRTALTLAELHGLSHAEIATVMGVRTEQVKAYAYQARANLISERAAHETACRDIREELATAHGVALRRTRLYRHLRSCSDCQQYKQALSRQRQHLAALIPAAPSLALKFRALHDVLGSVGLSGQSAEGAVLGGSVAGTAAAAGGGMNALVAKLAAGAVALGAGAGVSAAVLDVPIISDGNGSKASSGEVLPARVSGSPQPNARALAASGSPSRLLPLATRAAREGGHVSRLLAADYAAPEAPPAPRPASASAGPLFGESTDTLTAHSVVSAGDNSSRTPLHTPADERRRAREESQRQREERQQIHDERHERAALRGATARQERRQRREEAGGLGGGLGASEPPPKSAEERHRQHEQGKGRLEERPGKVLP
jgi:RNA polymerase sigma factor (sigma-70 family)